MASHSSIVVLLPFCNGLWFPFPVWRRGHHLLNGLEETQHPLDLSILGIEVVINVSPLPPGPDNARLLENLQVVGDRRAGEVDFLRQFHPTASPKAVNSFRQAKNSSCNA